ncbi:Molybdenum cofactor synthesis protein 1 [Nowakowskiella sp. JEL0407]|nr:Molybdenum cofactor synthesis protein 1 [Nowakowskiella sp. JEL0407]
MKLKFGPKQIPNFTSLPRYISSSANANVTVESHVSLMQRQARDRISAIDAIKLPPKPILSDNFNRSHTYLRISLTERCNLRCTYCMPEEGIELTPNSQLLTAEEIVRLAKLFVLHGVTKIKLTGGEPTVRKDLIDIVGALNELRTLGLKHIGITTNGIALKRKLPKLLEYGLDGVNISLDTLDKFKFELMTRRKGFENVMDSISDACSMPFNSVKLNAVVIRGVNDSEIHQFVEMTKDKNLYVRFIEYMPFDGNKWNKDKFVPYKEMLEGISNHYAAITKGSDLPNDTSKKYKIPGYAGSFGFITSMSDHFCGTCNRVRLLADGNLKVCLFGNAEVNLRDLIRNGATDEELEDVIGMAVKRKKKQHAETEYQRFYTEKISDRLRPYPSYLFKPQLFNSYPPISSLQNFESPRFFSTKTDKPEPPTISNHIGKSPKLTHVSESGKLSMVDVSSKTTTTRIGTAKAKVLLGKRTYQLILDNQIKKGDVLTVAKIAGIQAAKQTWNLIPLCHIIDIGSVKIEIQLVCDDVGEFEDDGGTNDLEYHYADVTATVTCVGRTGVEMEAMVAASIAACTIYDMCKAVNRGMRITDIRVVEKSGGASGHYKGE